MNVLGVTVFSGAACFVVEAATGDEPHVPVAHPDSNFCFT